MSTCVRILLKAPTCFIYEFGLATSGFSSKDMNPAENQLLCYDWDNGEVLSGRGDECSCMIVERTPHVLLRPILINAVECGYAYSQMDRDRRLNVRGVTIALWYFISRGHQAIALLPYCFKTYPDKSSSWIELMALFKMNLVEFTPGYGSDKYVEVNRILATRADDIGGCIVARSQMQNIVEERPSLNETIEKRLLMPSFNGDDIIFPIDGPLGRAGPTLKETLECNLTNPDWGRCSHHQMILREQHIWMQRLAVIVPEQVTWNVMLERIMCFCPRIPLTEVPLPPRPALIAHPRWHPPETNPIDGKGFSYTRAALRRANPNLQTQHMYREMQVKEEEESDPANDPFLPEYLRTAKTKANKEDEDLLQENRAPLPNYLGTNENSIYRIRPTMVQPPMMVMPPPPNTMISERRRSPVLLPTPQYMPCVYPSAPAPLTPVASGSSVRSSPRKTQSPRSQDSFTSHTSLRPSTSTQQPKTVKTKKTNVRFEAPAAQNVPVPSSSASQSQSSPTKNKSAEERLSKLAAIFGWEKAKRVFNRFPYVRHINLLVEYALNESDPDLAEPSIEPAADLIQFDDSASAPGSVTTSSASSTMATPIQYPNLMD